MKAYPAHNRAVNRGHVLRHILREGALARVDLAQRTGLTPAAVSNITRDLIADGLLHEVVATGQGRGGANAILLDLPTDRFVIGAVHQGVSALRIGLCDLRGGVLARRTILTPQRYDPRWAVNIVGESLEALLVANGRRPEDLLGVGFGAVGLVDAERGMIKRSPSIGWEAVPLRDLLEDRMRRGVVIENNIRAMAIAEATIGAGRSLASFALVYIGTGIGSGLIVDGRPFRGAYGGAGEIGHITVDPHGMPCSCGNRGCLETIAAEPAIVAQAVRAGIALDFPDCETTKDAVRGVARLAHAGDRQAQRVVDEIGESLGVALATLVDVINPGRIVLHGAIVEAREVLFAAVDRSLRQRAFLAGDEEIRLESATFGLDAGLVGAAIIALDALVMEHGAIPLLDELSQSPIKTT